jgi:hypothetical protein
MLSFPRRTCLPLNAPSIRKEAAKKKRPGHFLFKLKLNRHVENAAIFTSIISYLHLYYFLLHLFFLDALYRAYRRKLDDVLLDWQRAAGYDA